MAKTTKSSATRRRFLKTAGSTALAGCLEADEAGQQSLHKAVAKTIGSNRGNDPQRANNARALLRAKLAQRRAYSSV